MVGGAGLARSRSARYSSTGRTTQPSGGAVVCAIETALRKHTHTSTAARTRRARSMRSSSRFDTGTRQLATCYDAPEPPSAGTGPNCKSVTADQQRGIAGKAAQSAGDYNFDERGACDALDQFKNTDPTRCTPGRLLKKPAT